MQPLQGNNNSVKSILCCNLCDLTLWPKLGMQIPETVSSFILSISACYGLNICVPQNSCIETLLPNVMVLGVWVLGR